METDDQKKRAALIGIAKGQIHVPASFFEPLPDDILRAFEGEGTDCFGLRLNSDTGDSDEALVDEIGATWTEKRQS